jgi:hypothetical protein
MSHFNLKIVVMKAIQHKIMKFCNKSWFLFFEDNCDKFKGTYVCMAVYSDYKKYCEEDGNIPFSN